MAANRLTHDLLFVKEGFHRIAGIDEAGRGPLAGPVVAAAVVLPPGVHHPGINDSKKLSPQKREELFFWIREHAEAVGVGSVDAEEIDRVNILQATFRAMRQALAQIAPVPDLVLVDGPYTLPGVDLPQRTLIGGDALSASVAAASIIAKVTRDRLMRAWADRYPRYGFDRHKGYGTASHLQAIARYGPCPLHRKTFAGVVKQQLRMDLST